MIEIRPKICILFCGGAGILVDNKKIIGVKKPSDIKEWFKNIPELDLMAEIKPIFISGEEASEINPDIWLKIGREIAKRYRDYDGFIITQGLDTIIYTASAFSFMFQNLTKPIILTGSPLGSPKSKKIGRLIATGVISNLADWNSKGNFINAVKAAAMDIAEVAIVFGNRILRGNQTVKSEYSTLNFFESFRVGPLGYTDFRVAVAEHTFKRRKGKPKINLKLEKKVYLIQLFPGIDSDILNELVDKGYKGVVVRTFLFTPFPDNFNKVLKKAYQKKMTIVAHNNFGFKPEKEKKEYIFIRELTLETTLTKLMWILGQTSNLKKIREIFYQNLAGEFDS